MQKTITQKVDADVLRRMRELAEEEGISTSAFVEKQLRQILSGRKSYKAAKKRALVRLRKGFDLNWKPKPFRDDVHDRTPAND